MFHKLVCATRTTEWLTAERERANISSCREKLPQELRTRGTAAFATSNGD